jgi:hypothetical protein
MIMGGDGGDGYEKLDIGNLLVTELHKHCMHPGDPAQCNDGCWERGQELAAQIERDVALRIDQAIARVVRVSPAVGPTVDSARVVAARAVLYAAVNVVAPTILDDELNEVPGQLRGWLAQYQAALNSADHAHDILSGEADL